MSDAGSRADAEATDASRLRALFDSVRDGALVYDADGRLLALNARARELAGVDEAGVERLSLARDGEAAHPIPPLPVMWPAVLGEKRRITTYRAQSPSGKTLDLEVCARPLQLEGAPALLVELRDITAYKQSERALVEGKRQLEGAVLVRTRELQEKIALIEEQQRSLLALSTPALQVWDGILVLPLIGGIDDERARQLTESALASVSRTASRHLILDLTGVPALGDAASAALARTIRAVGLLGAGCSLAGMSAAVAQGLAHCEVGWSLEVRIFGDLQAALRAAIADEAARRAPR